jgi:hypothetical protein
MEPITFEALKALNPSAHQQALAILAECNDPDGVPEEDVTVTPSASGVFCLDWVEYGPFNPRPEWMWDPEASVWVSNDDEDVEERYRALEKLYYAE